jgi:hypothetical protein
MSGYDPMLLQCSGLPEEIKVVRLTVPDVPDPGELSHAFWWPAGDAAAQGAIATMMILNTIHVTCDSSTMSR